MKNTCENMLLVGVGGTGCAMARAVDGALGGVRHLLVDTDASSLEGAPCSLLLGAERLGGRGTGGEIVSARLAAEDSAAKFDEFITGVRIAVIAAALGGGTGGGATLELARLLAARGIAVIVFATMPYAFEGEARQRSARGIAPMIAAVAGASFFVPLDDLAGGCDEMAAAMEIGRERMGAAIALFWRIVATPGYIRLDVERLRHIVQGAGRGRFAVVKMRGPKRAELALASLASTPLLVEGTNAVRFILCGILAGDDLRLSEIALVADGLKCGFGGGKSEFELATVNDEKAFSGDFCVVAMMFEQPSRTDEAAKPRVPRKGKVSAGRRALMVDTRFKNVEPTIWNDQDLDVPAFLRQNITLEF